MPRLKVLLAGLAAALMALSALPAAAQPRKLDVPPGDWSPSGISVSFPDRIGDYGRSSVTEFGANDWAVGYQLIRNGKFANSVTIYIYSRPADETCDGEYYGSRAALERANPNAASIDETRVDAPRGTPGAARLARYTTTGQFDGSTQKLSTDLYVACKTGSTWFVKYRATAPIDEDTGGDAMTLLRAISWPEDAVD